jgi:hypothetical protein
MHYVSNHKVYFLNHNTQQTSWSPPRPEDVVPPTPLPVYTDVFELPDESFTPEHEDVETRIDLGATFEHL